jgi:diguanylate cyclase (GGDEF)-like protein
MASKHSNTIDFDAAKLQRLGYASKREPQLLPITLGELRQQLTLLLQTSLDVERIMALFFQEVQRLVPLDALSYQHNGSELRLDLGKRGSHSVSYVLNHMNDYMGELLFRRNQRFSEDELAQLESLLAALLFPLRNALLYRDAVRSALRDPLTGTGNRLAMTQALQREIELSRRSQQPLAVLMLDIDHFKRINDLHGHAAGDEALRSVAQTLKAQLRNIDMVFRYGGEEFLVLLSSTNGEAAAMVGERLRQAVHELQLSAEGQSMELSISLGCACLQVGESSDQLLQRADMALLQAKRGGRNRLRMAC